MGRKLRKRKRTRLKPKPILWLLLTIVVTVGIFVSPITAVRRVRIEGALPGDQERLTQLVKPLQGIPCVRIDPRGVESAAMELPEVKSAELRRNPFGSALLTVKYRQPVAKLASAPNMMLDSDGVLYPSMQTFEGIPVVTVPRSGPPTLVTVAGNWQPQRLAKLASIARTLAPADVISLQVSESGVVSVRLGSKQVIFGSLDDLDRKVDVLKERMVTYPNELTENEALNLTQPDFPAVVPKRGR